MWLFLAIVGSVLAMWLLPAWIVVPVGLAIAILFIAR
jgi:hypothetical protein